MKKLIAVCGFAFTLAACADQSVPPMQTGGTLPPKIVLNVQSISLTDRSGMQPANSPYNSNHFTPTISDAIKQWAGDRLQAAGASGTAIVIVKDASLTSQPLPMEGGIDSWFTRQQASKYVAHADVSVEANNTQTPDATGGTQAYAVAEASAQRSVTLPENASPIERQDAYYALLNGLMKDLGENLESSIRGHMGSFLGTPIVGYMPPATSINSNALQAGLAPQAGDSSASPQTAQYGSLAGVAREQMPAPQAPVFGVSSAPSSSSGALSDSALQPQAAYNNASASSGSVTIPLSGPAYTR